MRIAVVGEFGSRAIEGAASSARALVTAFRTAGSGVVDMTTLADGRSERTAVLQALRKLRGATPDIVYYVPKSGATAAAFARAAAIREATRRPVIVGCLQAGATFPRIPRQLRPDHVLVPSARLAALARAADLPCSVVPIGVDGERFAPSGPSHDDLWPDPPRTRLLHVGHLTRSRNLRVFGELSRLGYSCLVVASPSTDVDVGVVQHLEGAGVAIVHERLADIASVYRAADVYVFPVLDPRGCIEVPLSVLEARACGTPVVATPFGVLPELAASDPGISLASPDAIVGAVPEVSARGFVEPPAIASWLESANAHLAIFEQFRRDRKRPRFVVLVGVDGSGKSTQAGLLADAAATRGLDAVTVWARWKPIGLRPFMSAARRASVGRSDAGAAYARHMSMKRRVFRSAVMRRMWEWVASIDHCLQTVPRVRAALRSRRLVIADRYYHDALVDMGANFGSDAPEPHGLFRFFPRPDRVILLDAPEEVVIDRKRDVPSLDYLKQRRPLYLAMAKRHGWPIVDATRTAEEVHREIADIVWSSQR